VAEDNDGVRATVVDMLADLGYRVLTAKDAASALNVIESGVPIDLLFTDVVMPGKLRSTELARMARERLPGIGVLFTSGFTENSIVHDGRLDPGVELLSKPYGREALAHRVRAVLVRRRDAGSSAAPARGMAGIRVLVCEDDALIRLNTADMLQEAGATVIEAGSGARALACLDGTPPDVFVIDVGLPDMTGVELAQRVREVLPGVPVIFATGHLEVPGIEGMARVETVRKPFDQADLRDSIQRLIARA
jgi:CheY-like chemotaxis protein